MRELIFGYHFNYPLNNCLLNLHNLRVLTFGSKFNHSLGDSLLDLHNLQKLTFGHHFNQSLINSLVGLYNLRELTFGYYFNQMIDIPEWITKLSLNCNFQQVIDYLPSSIEELVFGYDCNLELNDLPSSIKKITIKNLKYNKKLNNLPNLIETLEISSKYKMPIDREYKNLNVVYLD